MRLEAAEQRLTQLQSRADELRKEIDQPVLETMAICGSLEWTRQRAEEEADKAIAAIQVIPDSPWRDALIGLAHIAVQRDR